MYTLGHNFMFQMLGNTQVIQLCNGGGMHQPRGGGGGGGVLTLKRGTGMYPLFTLSLQFPKTPFQQVSVL